MLRSHRCMMALQGEGNAEAGQASGGKMPVVFAGGKDNRLKRGSGNLLEGAFLFIAAEIVVQDILE